MEVELTIQSKLISKMLKIVYICILQVRDGTTKVFSGTDILSESGVASGYQEYESGFDFSGTITTL